MIDLVFRDTDKNIAAAEVFDPGLSGYDAQAPTKTRVVGGFQSLGSDFMINHCRSTSKPKATRTVGIGAYDIVRLNHVSRATD